MLVFKYITPLCYVAGINVSLRYSYYLFRNHLSFISLQKRRDSSVGIVLGYGLDDRGSTFRFLAETGTFSLHHRVHNGSGVHPNYAWSYISIYPSWRSA
jgi:hypothetical protein